VTRTFGELVRAARVWNVPGRCRGTFSQSQPRYADHPDVAVRPGLGGSPLDEVVHVAALLGVHEIEGPLGTPGPADVGDHVNVAARDEEVARPGFDESHRCAEVLNLPWVRRSCDQHGIRALRLRPVDVRQQPGPVTHWYLDVVVAYEGVGRFREIPVLTTGCLRSVQLPLTWGGP
jgi:hypothetical protein